MRALSLAVTENAKLCTEKSFGHGSKNVSAMDAVIAAARALFKKKVAANLASRAGVCPRACEYWLSRKTDLSADALANLLRSDAGFEILERIMGNARPIWWQQFKHVKDIGVARRKAAELKRMAADQDARIAQLEMNV